MSAHIKTRQERQAEKYPSHPGNELALWARLKLADAEIAELRAALASHRGVDVPDGWREFIENIATPYSEPLNSISGYRSKDERKIAMGALRATAQKLLAAAPQPPAVKEAEQKEKS